MKIGILGIGGVGGYYGGKLASCFANKSRHEIIFIARGIHLGEIQNSGLKIISPESTYIARPTLAVENPGKCGIFDLLLVCVKTYDLANALELVSGNINSSTIIIPLINGIDPVEKIKWKFPGSTVFQGCCYLNAYIKSPGTVKFRGGLEQILIGCHNAEKLSVVSDLFSEAGINYFSAPGISKQVWEKYIFGSTISSVGAIENESFGEIISDPERMKLLDGMIEEVLSVANSKGMIFENDFKEKLIEKISSYPGNARSSMQLDFVTGKKTELETFTGYVVKCGEESGINVSNYKMVYELLKTKKSFRGN